MTEAELYQAVVAAPEDDTPRRAYASWAKSHGMPRAELIEIQLAEAALHREINSVSAWGPLHTQAEALLKQHRYIWELPVADLRDNGAIADIRFYRGFIEHVSMEARRFEELAPEVFACAPIRHLSLSDVAANPQTLSSPHLARIGTLSLQDEKLDDEAIEYLARSPYTRRLRYLNLSFNRITRRGLEALCASLGLRGVLYINWVANAIEDPTDRYFRDGESITYIEPTPLGLELEAKYGPIAWLHAPGYFEVAHPPLREDAIDQPCPEASGTNQR